LETPAYTHLGALSTVLVGELPSRLDIATSPMRVTMLHCLPK
jgi:hypothetical protein